MKNNIRKVTSLFFLLILFFGFEKLSAQTASKTQDVTILYTNDFHSAFDPIPAYWLKNSPRLGGAAHLATLINQIRAREPATFLFDAGDMFTGQLSNITKGEALMEMMRAMRYDAMGIGNHEFDYGADNFEKQMNRVPFPVLGANIFYKNTKNPYSRPYTILEKNGVRLGVIGIIGEDARSVAWQEGITNLDFADPIPIVRALVKELKPQVDLIVVIAHQGNTGPMQTDAEARPEVQRDFDEDIRLCGAVEGIDVFVGGHAHRGIEKPFVHPKTGTLIVQTYGYGTRLGYLKLKLENKKVVSHAGELLKVWSDRLAPDREVAKKVEYYKQLVAPQIGQVVGKSKIRLVRDYNRESSLGNFITDVFREVARTDIAMTNAGGLRGDLPEGDITKGNVLDAFPFLNKLVVAELNGAQIKTILEQSLSLKRGLMQVSGLRAFYDMKKPIGQRLIKLEIGGKSVDDKKIYKVATNSFIGDGGDLYETFAGAKKTTVGGAIAEVLFEYFKKSAIIEPPKTGRLIPANE